ncbi:hypothetical protein ACFFMN_11845 [Planobispora siamensis]|uniref:Uncharacterized protein n=1 Tax=Planobispora siamensis TaxID=936338 RepID=A0A8J3WIN7_9ACTN|nr:hypothetical protein [Planobispora siamensis]GIH89957.1 hypothetical protein Psi01_05870 [Planobispora siamensis]
MLPLAPRPGAAVKTLETLQEQERSGAGLSPVETDHAGALKAALARARTYDRMPASGKDKGPDDFTAWAASMPDFASPEAGHDLDARVAEAVRAARLDRPGQWSKYELPPEAWRLADTCGRIEAAIARLARRRASRDFTALVLAGDEEGWTLPEPPAVGTLGTGRVSATTRRAPSGEPVVLLDNGIFAFARMLAQLGVTAVHEHRETGRPGRATMELVSDLVAAQVVMGTCDGTYARLIPPPLAAAARVVQDSVVTFVVAHEYAHLLNGDLDAHPPAGPPGDGLREREFAADGKALRITLSAAETPGADDAPVLGPVLFLAGLDLLDRARAAYEDHADRSAGDPCPDPRERMTEMLATVRGSQLGAAYADSAATASRAYDLVLLAWDTVRPAVREAAGELARHTRAGTGPSYLPEGAHRVATATLWRHVEPRLG